MAKLNSKQIEQIFDYIEENGIDRKEYADRTGVSITTLNRFEKSWKSEKAYNQQDDEYY